MKKQNTPREFLIYAPKNNQCIRLGWELGKSNNGIFDEFYATRKIYKQKVSKKYIDMMDKNLSNYIDRYL